MVVRASILASALLLLMTALLGAAPPVMAATPTPAPSPRATDPIDVASTTIEKTRATVVAVTAAARRPASSFAIGRMADRAEDAASDARHAVATLAAALADPALTDPRRAAIVARIGEGGRVAVAADKLAATLEARPSQQFDRTMAARTASPLAASFWSAAYDALPKDSARLGRFMAVQADATWRGADRGGVVAALLGLVAAAVLLFPVRLRLRRAGRTLLVGRLGQSRLRRSGWAAWTALLGAALPWLAMLLLYEGFVAAGMVSAPWQRFARAVVAVVPVAAAVSSVAGALLRRGEPSWRLLPVGDETAAGVRPWTIAAAAALFVTVCADLLLFAAGLSAAARDAVDVGEALLHTLVSAGLLLAIGRARRRAAAEAPEGGETQRELIAVAVVALAGWLAVAATLVALATGYVALAQLVARLLVWLPLVAATLYLAWAVIDDLAGEALSGGGALGRTLHRSFGVRPSVVDQTGVAVSAALRIAVLLVAAVAAFAPFGSSLTDLGAPIAAVLRGVTIGEVTIAPGAILRGLVVLAVALFLVHRVERWLADRYLPTTELDAGTRNSITTITRYLGFILAVSWGLAALGIGFQRIALVLSALSVGIGFGLQAITQNFVSGLILLVERPVKIGDLVEVGGQQGDVKRISVRATEIRAADRSTLIVPNSELITKTVRNLTLADALGVVSIKFTVPLDTDVATVRQVVLAQYDAAEAVLETPAPSVLIASLDDGVVHFSCTAYCESPRKIPATRSDLLFGLITELRERGITIGSSPTMIAMQAAPPGSAGLVDGG